MTRYNELHNRLIKETEDECIITAKEVLGELKRIGFADIKDFLSFRTAKTVVRYEQGFITASRIMASGFTSVDRSDAVKHISVGAASYLGVLNADKSYGFAPGFVVA